MVERLSTEFWCDPSGQGCGVYFTTFLRSNHNGSFTIQCPSCKHHHFRKIVNGIITSDRDYKAQEQKQIIVGLGPVSKTPWHDNPEYRRSLLKSVNK